MKQKIIILLIVGIIISGIFLINPYEGIDDTLTTTPIPTTPITYTIEDANSYLKSSESSISKYIYNLLNAAPQLTCPTIPPTTTPKPTCPTCPTPAPISCIADYGTNIGDKLSGGKGVLQDTRYVCPNTLKKCSHFKCGSAFGTCTSE